MKRRLSYKRQVLFKDKKMEVVVITWPPESESLPHDHGRSTGTVMVLEGCITEQVYDRKTRVQKGYGRYTHGDIIQETPDIIHIMKNDSCTEKARTLHIYTPPLKMKNYRKQDLIH